MARLDLIKFNLVRAIERFEDLNYHDMDVSAPSSIDYAKEYELAEKLNDYLGQLIDDGFFDDCEPREQSSSSSEEENQDREEEEVNDNRHNYHSDRSTPRSAGFEPQLHTHTESRSNGSDEGSTSGGSRGSFSDRFRRYIRRIIPGSGRSRSS